MKRTLFASVAIFLAGCASVPNNYAPVTTQISEPAINAITSAALGEQMLRQGTATLTQGVFVPQQNNISGFILSPGFYPKSGEDRENIFTSFDTRNNGFGSGFISLQGGLFGQAIYPQAIRFNKNKQETCVMSPNIYGMMQPTCDTEYPYQLAERPFRSVNDFQQTLIYSGRVGDKIKISYREFSNDLARSAFTNDAEYDLSTSNIIAYKGARLEVLEADNEKITYRVLSNFNLSK